MANSQLIDKYYKIPPDILKNIRTVLMSNPSGDGVKRAKFILKNGSLTYQSMKRIKHDLEHMGDDQVQFALAGGDLMKSFIDRMLNADRDGVERSNSIKKPIMPNLNMEMQPNSYSLNEEKKELIKNSLCIIVNGDNKFLLLKRMVGENYWGSGKWGLVGGMVEKKEKPEEACRREVEEETGLVLGSIKKRFTIQRNPNETEYIYVSKYDGDGTNIRLNDEHTNYGWFDLNEMKELDTVPQLQEYLVLAFKEYV